MVMFQIQAALALELIAIMLGMGLIGWMKVHQERTFAFYRGIVYFTMVLAFVLLAATVYCTAKFQIKKYFWHVNMIMQSGEYPVMMQSEQGKQTSSNEMMNGQKNMPSGAMMQKKQSM